ncbi:glucanase B [Mollisia scopiformis]|uniref:Glucanase B n=1 Tax=Mollisia scopiformis TaxID=149040 RepID=A0A194XWG0_MOLSC|nr:glucanase B [Mollisia scopiformis]KUJ24359.1 glucanase B [Mollisia scopiformis]
MTNSTLSIQLQNQTSSSTVYAYITGIDASNGSFVLIQADGHSTYYPQSPSSVGSPLAVDCGIKLGAPGSSTPATIPQMAGGRIWFCINNTLTFLLNPGPGLVEPSVSNPSDPNYSKTWGFCEFTFNSFQLFANITYVDFVSVPIQLSLTNTSGAVQNVPGIPSGGLGTVCSGLQAQNAVDNAGWNQLIVNNSSGQPLRALSPNTGIVMNNNLFSGYYANYVSQVWAQYASNQLSVNTQAQWGTTAASIQNGLLTFPGVGTFAQPSAADIFSCSTGPFSAASWPQANTAEMGNLTARLAAAFNRSTLLLNANQPDGEVIASYYQNPVTNHYSRIVHATAAGGLGYAFPYDDVAPSGQAGVAGTVSDGNPEVFTITVLDP